MEEYPGYYKPSPEEIEKAESMMKWWQKYGSQLREGTYGQLNEQERATWREMQMKGEMYMNKLKKAGLLDKSFDELLQDAKEEVVQKSQDGKTASQLLEEASNEFDGAFPKGSL